GHPRSGFLFLEFGCKDRRRRIPSFSRATESRMQQPCAHRHAGYAVIVIPLGWWRWNVLLLALLFRAHRKRVVNERAPRLLNRDSKTVLGVKRSSRMVRLG